MARARSRSCGRVDAERRRVDERDIDPHARLQRPQLFEFLAPLQRRRGQADKSPKRLAAIGVKTDVVQQAPLAPGSARAGEIERPQPGRTEFGRDNLDDVGVVLLLLARDRRRERRDVDRALGKRRKTGAHDRRFDGRQVALNVDHDVVNAVGVDSAQRLENAVGPGRVIETGHDRFAAGRGDRLHDARIVRRHPDRSDIRFRRPAPDMDDHRRAVNVGERLSRQAGRVHARGDEDDGVGHQFRLSQIRGATAYTCCQGERKAANQLSKTNVPPGSPNLTPADESPFAHGPRECEPVRALGARGGVVRHAAHGLQQSRPVAANA